ncbi:hypothetical protein Dda_8163 [Drechslerella dactyloides]|uniref:F-box domain-containing protein n=1 Tax=Drechslerella dactyloides TaxID=74499 RepID=A0AAD6NGE5_DREDA|nr:hypothetical protein Dda_8163 [Drechslerella dactyloides]
MARPSFRRIPPPPLPPPTCSLPPIPVATSSAVDTNSSANGNPNLASSSAASAKQATSLLSLPIELHEEIFSYLDLAWQDHFRLATIHPAWAAILQSDRWRNMRYGPANTKTKLTQSQTPVYPFYKYDYPFEGCFRKPRRELFMVHKLLQTQCLRFAVHRTGKLMLDLRPLRADWEIGGDAIDDRECMLDISLSPLLLSDPVFLEKEAGVEELVQVERQTWRVAFDIAGEGRRRSGSKTKITIPQIEWDHDDYEKHGSFWSLLECIKTHLLKHVFVLEPANEDPTGEQLPENSAVEHCEIYLYGYSMDPATIFARVILERERHDVWQKLKGIGGLAGSLKGLAKDIKASYF